MPPPRIPPAEIHSDDIGVISYWVARVSPALEDFLFKPFKWIRIKGYKAFFNIFVAQKHNVEKKGSGGALVLQEVCQ